MIPVGNRVLQTYRALSIDAPNVIFCLESVYEYAYSSVICSASFESKVVIQTWSKLPSLSPSGPRWLN